MEALMQSVAQILAQDAADLVFSVVPEQPLPDLIELEPPNQPAWRVPPGFLSFAVVFALVLVAAALQTEVRVRQHDGGEPHARAARPLRPRPTTQPWQVRALEVKEAALH